MTVSRNLPVVVRSRPSPAPRVTRTRSLGRWVTRLVAALVGVWIVAGGVFGVGLAGFGNPSGQTVETANAFSLDLCERFMGGKDSVGDMKKNPMLFSYPGGGGLIETSTLNVVGAGGSQVGNASTRFVNVNDPTGGRPFADSDGRIVPTAQEYYGTAPFRWVAWSSEDLDSRCDVGSVVGKFTAQTLFSVVTTFANLGITLIGLVLSLDATTYFAGTVGSILEQLKDALFLTYLSPIVLLGTLWIAWKGLVKRQTTVATQGIVWMLLAGVLSLAFLTKGSEAVAGYSDLLQKGTLAMISLPLDDNPANSDRKRAGVGGSAGSASGTETSLCFAKGTNAELRAATCSLWETFLYTPWVQGQFGSGRNAVLTEEYPYIPGHGRTNRLPYVWMEAFTINHDQAVGGVGEYPPTHSGFGGLDVNEDGDRQRMIETLWGGFDGY